MQKNKKHKNNRRKSNKRYILCFTVTLFTAATLLVNTFASEKLNTAASSESKGNMLYTNPDIENVNDDAENAKDAGNAGSAAYDIINLEQVLSGQEASCVKDDLNFLTEDDNYRYEWQPDNIEIVENDGTVHPDVFCSKRVKISVTAYKKDSDTLAEKKEFYVTVMPSGENVFKETFSAEPKVIGEKTPIATSPSEDGYNGWRLSEDTYAKALEEGTAENIIQDGSLLNNRALEVRVKKKSFWVPGGTALLRPYKTLDKSVSSGIISANISFMPKNDEYCITFAPFGSILMKPDKKEPQFGFVCGLTGNEGMSGKTYDFTEEQKAKIKKDEWNTATFVADMDNKTMIMFINGGKVFDDIPLPFEKIENLMIYSNRAGQVLSNYLIDEIFINKPEISDEYRVELAAELLTLDKQSENKYNFFETGAFSTNVEWSSSDESVIGKDGKIKPVTEDKTVTVTATVKYGEASFKREFSVNVKAMAVLDAVYADFDFSKVSNNQDLRCVTNDLNLMTSFQDFGKNVTVEWTSDSEDCISTADGKLGAVMRQDTNKFVKLTAKISVEGSSESKTKEFECCVVGKGDVILFDNFNSEPGTDIATSSIKDGYNGWKLENDNFKEAKAEGTELTFKLRGEEGDDTSLSVFRQVNGTKPNNINLNAVKWTNMSYGLISYSFDMRSSTKDTLFRAPLTGNFSMTNIKFSDTAGTTIDFNKSLADGKWHRINYVLNCYTQSVDFYIDGEKIGRCILSNVFKEYNRIWFGMQRAKKGEVLIDNVLVNTYANVDQVIVDELLKDFKINDENTLSENTYLKDDVGYDVSASYNTAEESDALKIVGSLAVVNRRPDGDKKVKVKVKLTRNAYSAEKEIEITIPKVSQIEYDLKDFTFNQIGNEQREKYVTQKLNLINEYNGFDIVWSSSDEDRLNPQTGEVKRGDIDKLVKLTAKFKKGGDEKEKIFDVVIAAAGTTVLDAAFDDAETDGTEISGYNEKWSIDKPSNDDSVRAYITKDPYDVNDFEKANKALRIERYVNTSNGNPSGQPVSVKFNSAKRDITACDFDFMLASDASRLSFKFYNSDDKTINKLFELSRTYIMRKAFNNTKITFKNPLEVNKWYHLCIIADANENKCDIYLDYEKINKEPLEVFGLKSEVNTLAFYSNYYKSSINDKFMIDNVTVRNLSVSPEDAVKSAAAGIALNYNEDNYQTEIDLPDSGTEGTKISWTSSNENVVTNDGLVTVTDEERTATLTAHITKNGSSADRSFPITVKALSTPKSVTQDILDKTADRLTFEKISDESETGITKRLNLEREIKRGAASLAGGVKVDWRCGYPSVIKEDGEVIRQRYDVYTTLTAKIYSDTDPSLYAEKTFNVKVPMISEPVKNFNFEDLSEDSYGVIIDKSAKYWITKPIKSNTEYGMGYFADENIRKDSVNPSKTVLYLDKYFTGSDGPITYENYVKAAPDEKVNPYEFRGSIVRMKFLFIDDPNGNPNNDNKTGTMFTLQLGGILTEKIDISRKSVNVNLANKLTVKFNELLELNKWHNAVFFADPASKRLDIYIDDMKITPVPIEVPGMLDYISKINIFKSEIGTVLVDDVTIEKTTDWFSKNAEADASSIAVEPAVGNQFRLVTSGKNGSRIVWKSDDESIISNSGRILKSGSTTLTATVINGDKSIKKQFPMTVVYDGSKNIFELSVKISDGKAAASVKTKKSIADTAELIVEVSYKNEISKLYSVELKNININETKNIEIPIDKDSSQYGNVKAYVRDKNGEEISNTEYVSY